MSTQLNSSGITFPDSTTQTTAAVGISTVPNSLNRGITNFPIGTYLFVTYGSSPVYYNRNGYMTIYNASGNIWYNGGGTAISGTWQVRGMKYGTGNDTYLVQRTA